MAEAKTKPTKISPKAFLAKVADPQQKADCQILLDMIQKITGETPTMWGPSMIGFGKYHYKYESGHEGDGFLAGFAPRKGNLSIFITAGMGYFTDLLAKLGKHKAGKGCLYIKKLDDIDVPTLKKLIKESVTQVKKRYPA